jgi:hypothetical protein
VHGHALKPVWQVAWNYGANFGGPTKATWTSGANSLTAGSVSLHPMCAHATCTMHAKRNAAGSRYSAQHAGVAAPCEQSDAVALALTGVAGIACSTVGQGHAHHQWWHVRCLLCGRPLVFDRQRWLRQLNELSSERQLHCPHVQRQGYDCHLPGLN